MLGRKVSEGPTSMRGCQCAMGFLGYVSISFQWSRPRLSASLPTLQTPITSLCPTLWDSIIKKKHTHTMSFSGFFLFSKCAWKGALNVQTYHNPWLQWADWFGRYFLEEHQTQWLHCTLGSVCYAWLKSFFSLASFPHTSRTLSHMDLERDCKTNKATLCYLQGKNWHLLY